MASAHQVGGCRQHLVGGGDDLAVHFVGALRGDQIGDLAHRFDIGLLEIALLQVPGAVGGRQAILRRAELVAAVRATGFTFCALDLAGFRSGSMNALLQLTVLRS